MFLQSGPGSLSGPHCMNRASSDARSTVVICYRGGGISLQRSVVPGCGAQVEPLARCATSSPPNYLWAVTTISSPTAIPSATRTPSIAAKARSLASTLTLIPCDSPRLSR